MASLLFTLLLVCSQDRMSIFSVSASILLQQLISKYDTCKSSSGSALRAYAIVCHHPMHMHKLTTSSYRWGMY